MQGAIIGPANHRSQMGHLNQNLIGKKTTRKLSPFVSKKVTFQSSFQSSVEGGGMLGPKIGRKGSDFPKSRSQSRPVSAPFCARSAMY